MSVKKYQKKLVCVVGPTASGKTGLGVALARKYDGEIVSADSRQVFRKLDIGTGKDLAEYGEIPHHLIDILDAGDEFTMFDWLEKAKIALDDIWKRGKLPIVVGGTGLYVKALIQGFQIQETITKKPQRGPSISGQDINNIQSLNPKYTREELEQKSKEELQEILMDLDDEAFLAVDLNNPYRLIRSIEKAQSGEKVVKIKPDFEFILLGAERSREELHRLIDLRVDERFEQGMLEEVQGLLSSGVDKEWLLSLGLEYKIIGDFVCNKTLSYEEMVQELKWKIHQYARRQLTWWRRFDVDWVSNGQEAQKVAAVFLALDKSELIK